jgi:hypothetical protein
LIADRVDERDSEAPGVQGATIVEPPPGVRGAVSLEEEEADPPGVLGAEEEVSRPPGVAGGAILLIDAPFRGDGVTSRPAIGSTCP